MAQIEVNPKNVMNAPKCKLLVPKFKPVPFLLDNQEESEEDRAESISTNSSSYKSNKKILFKRVSYNELENELELSYED